jgi:predicted nucleotidyltransferase
MKRIPSRDAENSLIFMCITGSHLYGTSTKDSDWDWRGVFLLPASILLSPFLKIDTVSFQEQEDRALYPLAKFMDLCIAGHPNITELLFVYPPFCISTPIWDRIAAHRDLFISCLWIEKLMGFAKSEKKKMQSADKNIEKRDRAAYHYLRTLSHALSLIRHQCLQFPITIPIQVDFSLADVHRGRVEIESVIKAGMIMEHLIETESQNSHLPLYPSDESLAKLSQVYVEVVSEMIVSRSNIWLTRQQIDRWRQSLQDQINTIGNGNPGAGSSHIPSP